MVHPPWLGIENQKSRNIIRVKVGSVSLPIYPAKGGRYLLLVLPVFGILALILARESFSRAKRSIQVWAEENGLEVLQADRRSMRTGPFQWWTTSRGQIIYLVRVRDRDGRERSAWVRCGSYLGGVTFSEKIEVRWDEH